MKCKKEDATPFENALHLAQCIHDLFARDVDNAIEGRDAAPGIIRIWECERSEEHTSELQSQSNIVCRLLLEKKNTFSFRSLSNRVTEPFTCAPQWCNMVHM